MTETDATRTPLQIPPKFVPYIEKHMLYSLFKDMLSDILITRPDDHLEQMRQFLKDHLRGARNSFKILLLFDPQLDTMKKEVTKIIISELTCVAITRPVIMDAYERKFGSVSTVTARKMAETLKDLTETDPVPQSGWILMDHPCTLSEAQYMQRIGIFPSVTLYIAPNNQTELKPKPPRPYPRGFYEQDIDTLKLCFSTTRKDLFIEPNETANGIAMTCFIAIRSVLAGLQCSSKSFYNAGAPSVYRIVIIGPRGSGRNMQADMLARQLKLVRLRMNALLSEASMRDDDIGKRLRHTGKSENIIREVLSRRILQKDCLDKGWVLTEYCSVSDSFKILDSLDTPPNRLVFFNIDSRVARNRLLSRGYNCHNGKEFPLECGSHIFRHPYDDVGVLNSQLEQYYSRVFPELRAAAGLFCVEIDASLTIEQVQVNLQAGIMANSTLMMRFSGRG